MERDQIIQVIDECLLTETHYTRKMYVNQAAKTLAMSGHPKRDIDLLVKMRRNELVRSHSNPGEIIARTKRLISALGDPSLYFYW